MKEDTTPCPCCGDTCFYSENKDEPCYGAVEVVDEWHWDSDWMWIHGCEGHREEGKYVPAPSPQ